MAGITLKPAAGFQIPHIGCALQAIHFMKLPKTHLSVNRTPVIGYTHWNWLFIQQLWVPEGHRQHGIGSSLLAASESAALARGCIHAHCDTFDFQTLPFYQKLGYCTFGTLADYPPGHTRYFLSKQNLKELERPAEPVRPANAIYGVADEGR